MFETLLQTQYGLRLRAARRASSGAGSETWFLCCDEGDYVLKLPDKSAVNHPELCVFLRENGIPACDSLKNRDGSFLSADADGRVFTVQRRFSGYTPAWNCAPEELLLESSELLGKIHQVLRAYPALSEGIGAAFFANMTPRRAAESYRWSLETARRLGDAQSAAELEWRIGLMERFPAWEPDPARLTCRNTHGDYYLSQFICESGRLTAVIDWTAACVHPVIWELTRSFAYGAPCCAEGRLDRRLFARCVEAYCRYGTLNACDLENIWRLYFYQIAVCDYYGQYYTSRAANREIYLRQARLATGLLKNMPAILRAAEGI